MKWKWKTVRLRLTYLEGAENAILPAADVVAELPERPAEGVQVPENLKAKRTNNEIVSRVVKIAQNRIICVVLLRSEAVGVYVRAESCGPHAWRRAPFVARKKPKPRPRKQSGRPSVMRGAQSTTQAEERAV